MNFNSINFGLFLPIVFFLYWLSLNIKDDHKGRDFQNAILIVGSYFFYACFDCRFMVLLLSATLFSYYVGKKIEVSAKRRYWNLANIVLSVLLLIAFKYYNFFIVSASDILVACGLAPHFSTLRLIVPVGISFFLFQTMSYTIDIYRGEHTSYAFLDYTTYISFFPKLIAGPIERAGHFIPQIASSRKFNPSLATDGLRQMLWGFFKKVVIADNCASMVNTLWSQYTHLGACTLALAAVLFAVQIYADFSGYSDMAIGCGKLFGIRMCQNFNVPYFSRNIREFWRRWHISLMQWFRDYIYFPLGGSRCSKGKSFRNTLIVFAVSGLWHGANWTYIVWGLYHALLFLPLMIFGGNKYKDTVADGHRLPSPGELAKMLLTFVLVALGWIVFRSADLSEAINFITSMFSSSIIDLPRASRETAGVVPNFGVVVVSIVIMVVAEWSKRTSEHPLQFTGKVMSHCCYRWICYTGLTLVILYFTGSQSEFIYENF